MATFMDRAVVGEIAPENYRAEFEREIAVWSQRAQRHAQSYWSTMAFALPPFSPALHEHLGVTEAEYDEWCGDTHEALARFVAARRSNPAIAAWKGRR